MRGLLAIEILYHQIVAGNKIQTRRSGGLDVVNEKPDNWEITGCTGDENELEEVDFCDYMDTQRNIHCRPRYKMGEILYLKEPTAIITTEANPEPHIGYRYDLSDTFLSGCVIKWSNKLFMPAANARAFVRITGIRCERLLDISYSDAIAEGIQSMGFHGYKNYLSKSGKEYELTAIESFISLYKFANKVKEVPNIFVWRYTFEFLPNYKLTL